MVKWVIIGMSKMEAGGIVSVDREGREGRVFLSEICFCLYRRGKRERESERSFAGLFLCLFRLIRLKYSCD